MPVSLYQYSQLSCIVAALVFSITMMFIGNVKARRSRWVFWAKWGLTFVFFLVCVFTLLQYSLDLKDANPRLNTALNVTVLYAVTFVLAVAFIKIANRVNMTRKRLLFTFLIFTLCGLIVWLSTLCSQALYTILMVSSLALYLFELLRITIVFVVGYRALASRRDVLTADEQARFQFIKLLGRCVLLLTLFAVMYVFLVMWTDLALAIFNFASVLLWGYLFVTFVNMMIQYQPPKIDKNVGEPTDNQPIGNSYKEQPLTSADAQPATPVALSSLDKKVERWVATRRYCSPGVTMMGVAEELDTNRTYLSQYINKRYGRNFNAWLNGLRVEEAKRLLLSSPTLSLERVSMSVGFSSKSHFISSFKLIEGVTPGQWRLQHC